MSAEQAAEPPKKASKTLAEKGQHLNRIDVSRTVSGDQTSACSSTSKCEETSSQNSEEHVKDAVEHSLTSNECRNSQSRESDEAACSDTIHSKCVNEDVDVQRANSTSAAPHGNFKLGADSVDIDDATFSSYSVTPDGFLSPTSPTSPTSPDPDGTRSPLKSSMRDPNRPRTPPGTPSRKSVRFADALGLDLETVKTILRTESPPDLHVHVDEDKQTISAKVLSLCFQQPGGKPDFMTRLYSQNVCLENVVVHEFTLIGTIKVRNLGFEKEVRIRQSSDNWSSYVDTMAMYVQGSFDGPTDRFSFGLSGPRSMAPGAILSFAIYYKVGGQIFWDNNGGQNYSMVCEEVKKG